jgi:TDG/mug DNA glycosylase family protein
MYESGLVSEPIGHLDDGRLTEWGYGITNLVPRPTSGIDELRPAEYQAGRRVLFRKISRLKPEIVAFVGVTLYRAIFPQPRPAHRGPRIVVIGRRPERIHGAAVFVLPNPSGRNANFSYAEMLVAFVALRDALDREKVV